MEADAEDPVWYAAYGSNMSAARLRCYIEGGRPERGTRTLPGCRDTTMPTRSQAVLLPGRIFFALQSLTWTGGMAFYDPDADGEVAARAWLLTRRQFGDVLTQEMHATPGEDVVLTATRAGACVELGPGRYETVVHVGELQGVAMLTFTCPWRYDEVEHVAPSAAYRQVLVAGLAETHGWDDERANRYVTEGSLR